MRRLFLRRAGGARQRQLSLESRLVAATQRHRLVASSILVPPLRTARRSPRSVSTASSSSGRAAAWSPPAAATMPAASDAQAPSGGVPTRRSSSRSSVSVAFASSSSPRAILARRSNSEAGKRLSASVLGRSGAEPLEELDGLERVAAIQREPGAAKLRRRRCARPVEQLLSSAGLPWRRRRSASATSGAGAQAGREREKSSIARRASPRPRTSGPARGRSAPYSVMQNASM